MVGSAVIAGGEASKVLQFIEAALDAVALAVERLVVPDASLALRFDGITTFMPAALMVSRMALLS